MTRMALMVMIVAAYHRSEHIETAIDIVALAATFAGLRASL